MYAVHASRGRWKPFRHLIHLDRLVLAALTGQGHNRLIVTMPPRHGKSVYISQYTPAWVANVWPDRNTILSSYEANYAASWGRKARETYQTTCAWFGNQIDASSQAANEWRTHMGGGMQTAGAGGAITGKGAHLLICDDPIKNQEEAQSEVMREKIWDWWLSTAYTRLEPGGVAIIVMTRWNEDDLVGRLKLEEVENEGEHWEVVNLPAFAEENDPIGRTVGEALCPERYDERALARMEKTLGVYWWSALYQQRPAPKEGNMFKRHFFEIHDSEPPLTKVTRAWDLAASIDGDWTVGVKGGIGSDGNIWITDVVRDRLNPTERDQLIFSTSMSDGKQCRVRFQEDPGQAGKSQIEFLIRKLSGYTIKAVRPTGDKETRAGPYASQAGINRVKLLRGPWNRAFVDEHCSFPNGMYDDQVDAASDLFNELEGKRSTIMVG